MLKQRKYVVHISKACCKFNVRITTLYLGINWPFSYLNILLAPDDGLWKKLINRARRSGLVSLKKAPFRVRRGKRASEQEMMKRQLMRMEGETDTSACLYLGEKKASEGVEGLAFERPSILV